MCFLGFNAIDLSVWTEIDYFLERLELDSEWVTKMEPFFEWFLFNVYFPTLAWPRNDGIARHICTYPEFLEEKRANKPFSCIYTHDNFYALL